MTSNWPREQEWNRVRASIVPTRTFRRTQIVIPAYDENNEGFLLKTCWFSVVPRAEHFGDLITADQSESCEELILEILYVNTTQMRNWWDCWKSSVQCERRDICAEWKKGHLRCYWSPVWVTNGGSIPWNAMAISETFKISCLMSRHHERRFGMPFDGPVIPFGAMVEYHQFLRMTHRDQINLVQKYCLVYSSVMYLMRRDSGKQTLWSQTVKNWRGWTHQISTPEGSMQRKFWRRIEVDTSYSL